jgi:hypothetical protein
MVVVDGVVGKVVEVLFGMVVVGMCWYGCCC